jgi:hypothetical protein
VTVTNRAARSAQALACEDSQHYACEGVITEVIDLTDRVPACGCSCHDHRAPSPVPDDVA